MRSRRGPPKGQNQQAHDDLRALAAEVRRIVDAGEPAATNYALGAIVGRGSTWVSRSLATLVARREIKMTGMYGHRTFGLPGGRWSAPGRATGTTSKGESTASTPHEMYGIDPRRPNPNDKLGELLNGARYDDPAARPSGRMPRNAPSPHVERSYGVTGEW